MKAKLRKLQKEKQKQMQNKPQNSNNSLNENKSQSQAHNTHSQENNINNNNLIPDSNNTSEVIENKNIINQESEKEEVKALKKDLNPYNPYNNKNIMEKEINKEEYRQQELSKIATMFNFEINKEKKTINIKENDEYYDMRKQIKELEDELDKTKKEYDDLIIRNKKETEMNKRRIEEMESDLKNHVDNNIENLKKENLILKRDINILDKKLDSIKSLYQKEEYDMNNTINELDNIIIKLNTEISYVEDLKYRLKNLTNKEIPQELVNSINFNIKEDNDEIKDITDTFKFGNVKSKTGSIPMTDILDFSSIDSKRSIKKIKI